MQNSRHRLGNRDSDSDIHDIWMTLSYFSFPKHPILELEKGLCQFSFDQKSDNETREGEKCCVEKKNCVRIIMEIELCLWHENALK